MSFLHEPPNFVIFKAFNSLQQPAMKLRCSPQTKKKKELVTKLCHIIKSLLRCQQMQDKNKPADRCLPWKRRRRANRSGTCSRPISCTPSFIPELSGSGPASRFPRKGPGKGCGEPAVIPRSRVGWGCGARGAQQPGRPSFRDK